MFFTLLKLKYSIGTVIGHYFPVVLFTVFNKVVLTFESVDESLG